MSYDLFFRGRTSGAMLTREQFTGYFTSRRHYEVRDAQAVYGNRDTGVYFVFDYTEPESGSDLPEEPDQTDPFGIPVAFNLNYFRPHAFGLEAEPELRAFVEHFDLTVSDPQNSGMGDGEYSSEGFLRGWNAGNEFGYRACLSQAPEEPCHSLPAARIEAVWRWNYQRDQRQEQVGEGGFVPLLFFFHDGGAVKTGVAWCDGDPILLPEVDLLFVLRKRFAPRRWFKSATEDEVILRWDDVATLVKRFPERAGELPSFELLYAHTPADVERAIRHAKPPREKPKGLTFDQILDRELVDTARRSRR